MTILTDEQREGLARAVVRSMLKEIRHNPRYRECKGLADVEAEHFCPDGISSEAAWEEVMREREERGYSYGPARCIDVLWEWLDRDEFYLLEARVESLMASYFESRIEAGDPRDFELLL